MQASFFRIGLSSLPLIGLTAPAIGQDVCDEGRIASIQVTTQPIFADGDSAQGMLSTVYAAGNWLHVTTRESFVRRELLFREGDCAERLALSESERLLRGFRFLESASVESVRRPDGDVDVTVVTRDDWSLRLEPRFSVGGGFAFSGISLGETNLLGRGRTLELAYILRSGLDDVVLDYLDPQFMKTRWDFGVNVLHGGPGWTVSQAVAYPFLGLVGNWAAFQNLLYSERWFRYFVGDSKDNTTELLLPTLQKTFGLGGALRQRAPTRGRSTRVGSYGISLSYEDLRYSSGTLEDGENLPELDTAAVAATETVRPQEALRVNLVGGLRWLGYVTRRGVSTLGAVEDIALGAFADLLVGVAPRWFGMEDEYLLLGLDLYGGSRVRGNWFSILRANAEARRGYGTSDWRNVFAAVQWTNFWIVNSRSTNVIVASYSGGWETTVPFQLTLGGPQKLGGYSLDRFPGGARAILRFENRYKVKRAGELFDLGSVLFLDLGEMWSNGALFGVDSGFRASAGLGLRFAIPAGSRQTYRLQLGIPLDEGLGFSDLVFSFTIDRPLSVETQSVDLQLARSRDPAVRSAARYLK